MEVQQRPALLEAGRADRLVVEGRGDRRRGVGSVGRLVLGEKGEEGGRGLLGLVVEAFPPGTRRLAEVACQQVVQGTAEEACRRGS